MGLESIMEALRIIVEPTNQQVTIDLPPEMNSKRVEIIVLPAGNDSPPTLQETRHKPSPMLVGTVSTVTTCSRRRLPKRIGIRGNDVVGYACLDSLD